MTYKEAPKRMLHWGVDGGPGGISQPTIIDVSDDHSPQSLQRVVKSSEKIGTVIWLHRIRPFEDRTKQPIGIYTHGDPAQNERRGTDGRH